MGERDLLKLTGVVARSLGKPRRPAGHFHTVELHAGPDGRSVEFSGPHGVLSACRRGICQYTGIFFPNLGTSLPSVGYRGSAHVYMRGPVEELRGHFVESGQLSYEQITDQYCSDYP